MSEQSPEVGGYPFEQVEGEASIMKTAAQQIKEDEVSANPDRSIYHPVNVETAENMPTTKEHYDKAEKKAEKVLEIIKDVEIGSEYDKPQAILFVLEELALHDFMDEVAKMPEGKEKDDVQELEIEMWKRLDYDKSQWIRNSIETTRSGAYTHIDSDRTGKLRERREKLLNDLEEKMYGKVEPGTFIKQR